MLKIMIITSMESSAFPSESKCPECGGEPSEDSQAKKRLQNLGYMAEDIFPKCEDCGNQWKIGVPIGEYEEGSDLWCNSCNKKWMLVHFVTILERGNNTIYKMNLKCPNEKCLHYKTIRRESDSSGKVMMGYPPITGKKEGSEPIGRPE